MSKILVIEFLLLVTINIVLISRFEVFTGIGDPGLGHDVFNKHHVRSRVKFE